MSCSDEVSRGPREIRGKFENDMKIWVPRSVPPSVCPSIWRYFGAMKIEDFEKGKWKEMNNKWRQSSRIASTPRFLFCSMITRDLRWSDRRTDGRSWLFIEMRSRIERGKRDTDYSSLYKHRVPRNSFLDAPSHLYKRVCPSVRPSVVIFRRVLGASCAVFPAFLLKGQIGSQHFSSRTCLWIVF